MRRFVPWCIRLLRARLLLFSDPYILAAQADQASMREEKGTLIRRPSVNREYKREYKTLSVPEEPTIRSGFASHNVLDLRSLDFI